MVNKRLCTSKIKQGEPVRNQGGVSAIPKSGSISNKYPRNTHQIKQDKQEKAETINDTPALSTSLTDLMPPTEALTELKQSTAEVQALVEEVKVAARRGRRKKDGGEEEVVSDNS